MSKLHCKSFTVSFSFNVYYFCLPPTYSSFTVFSIAKDMNKVVAWSGCPVSNPDSNNTVGLFPASFCAREPGKTGHSIGFALRKYIDQNEEKEWIMIPISTVTG